MRIVKNEATIKDVVPEDGNVYKIVLRNNPDYVLSYAGEAVDDANVQISSKAEESQNQEWMFIPVEGQEGYYRISPAANPQMCIDINWGRYENGRNLNLYTYGDGAGNRHWRLEPTGSGYYSIQPQGDTSFCIDEADITPKDGSNAQIWKYSFGDRQQWRLEKVGGETEPVQTAAPVFESNAATISASNTAAFSLSNVLEGEYRVYAGETESEALTDPAVRIDGNQLLLTFSREPETDQIFYISAIEEGKTESERTEVKVIPYVSSYGILKTAIDSARALPKELFTEESYAALEQALEAAQAAYKKADLTSEETQTQAALLETAIRNLEIVGGAEYQELSERLQKAQADLQKAGEDLKEAQEEAGKQEELATQASQKVERLKGQISELENQKKGLEQEQGENETKISQLNTRLESLKTQLEEEKELAAQRLIELEAANERVAQLETANKLLESQVAAARQEVEDVRLEAQKKAEEEADKAKKESEEAADKAKKEAQQAIEQAKLEAQEAVRKAGEETKKLQAELDVLKAASLPKAGDTVKKSGVAYRITDVQRREVQAYQPTSKKLRSIRILDQVEIQGQAYTVTSIADALTFDLLFHSLFRRFATE